MYASKDKHLFKNKQPAARFGSFEFIKSRTSFVILDFVCCFMSGQLKHKPSHIPELYY